ncbi:hypothetical protein FM103_03295 [Corynebacterium xerosis]|nr:hypothetical protein FM103_03295 [Corynebacterium xerosis]
MGPVVVTGSTAAARTARLPRRVGSSGYRGLVCTARAATSGTA